MATEKNPITGLNKQEETFCEIYATSGDVVKAYSKAYPTYKGSAGTKKDLAFAMLHKPEIKKYLKTLRIKNPDKQHEFFLNAERMAQLFMKMYSDTNNPAERSIALKALENLAKSKFCDFFEKEQTNVNILNVTRAEEIDSLLGVNVPKTIEGEQTLAIEDKKEDE